MSPKRYFTNNMDDYSSGKVTVPKDVIKSHCMEYLELIFKKQTQTSDDCDGGLYVGLTGVGYMCYYLSRNPEFKSEKQELLKQSIEYLKPSLSYDSKSPLTKTAFLLGGAGSCLLAAVVASATNQEEECETYLKRYASMADKCLNRDYLGCGSDELFVGRAGYLDGALYLNKTFGRQIVPQEKISALCEATLNSGIKYSKEHKYECPLMYAYHGTEYFGAAHGISSILQMLLSFPHYLDRNKEAEQKVKESVDFLLNVQTETGNFPTAMDEVGRPRSENKELVHWCHGAPGVVYLMAKAFLRWKEDKYLQSCIKCGEIVWQKGLLKKGPGICHGVAGNGYVFLLLYRLTDNEKYLHRALQFAHFLFGEEFKQANTPDRPLSLFEGLAGTVCFLSDLLHLEEAHFPFFEVF